MPLAQMIQQWLEKGCPDVRGLESRTSPFAHVGVLLCLALLPALTVAAENSKQFAAIPPLIIDTSTPNVMLVMSDDHELYKKAYSDYSDLDGDGEFDQSYKDDFTYTGYFDSNFCYSYDSTNTYFVPNNSIASNIAANGHRCDTSGSNLWSGNFLNWATMTRMDIVRHVLYGGKRITDTKTTTTTPGQTVLERAFLPEDSHAFVKVYAASDVKRFTPYDVSAVSLCNITMTSETSPPLMRVAFGDWSLWSTSNLVQCHYTNEYDSGLGVQPGTGTSVRPTNYNFDVQVSVCVAGKDAVSERCKAYIHSSNGLVTYKPIGLMQQYGDNGNMNFGLITGSYNRKIDGGVLRKNILPLVGNATAADNEIDLDTGQFLNQSASSAGIINALSRFRIVNWNYSSNVYSDCNTYSIPKSDFKALSPSSTRVCRNWGNPLSEIYLEALRYFTGDEAVGATSGNGKPSTTATSTSSTGFDVSDSDQIASLPQISWKDPINSLNYCATCSIIVLSTGLNSFDTDGLATVTDLWKNTASSTRMSLTDVDALVNTVGDLEGITGGSYLVGRNGVNNDEICNAKTITNLSDVQGICPEIPGLEGGYDIAGLAYHANTSDLRKNFDGDQNISTYSVALAENLPTFELNVNGDTVAFVPTCHAHLTGTRKLDQNGWTACSFLNAKIETLTSNGGRMYIAWEDSLWGSDYDLDVVSRIEWCIGDAIATNSAACPGEAPNANYGTGYSYAADFAWKTTGLTANSIQLRVSAVLASAGNALKLGYSISGVANVGNTSVVTNTPNAAMNTSPTTAGTKNIARAYQGNGDQVFLLREGNYTITRLVNNSGNRLIYHAPLVYTASPTETTGKLLQNPLWYTAKYGGAKDINRNGVLDQNEWDVRSIDGTPGPDGIPDGFFPVRNPSNLAKSLGTILDNIVERISSGTAAAVTANSSTGLGAVYQAYYNPRYSDADGKAITWGGVLHSMFIDESGRYREDKGIKGKLESPDIDRIIDIDFRTGEDGVVPSRAQFHRYDANLNPVGTWEDLEQLDSIWNARNVLADISQADLIVQRSVNPTSGQFSENAGSKRYIFTFLDHPSAGAVGQVDNGEVVSFTESTFDPSSNTNWRYLGLGSSADAKKLVNYIRGQDQTGWRPRLTDLPGDGVSTKKYWILGDIVHSSPTVVSPPNQRYDIAFGDETYNTFKRKYARRRQMVYVGANDGMLHAFNGGAWDPINQKFETQSYNPATNTFNAGQAHTLGAEMWAYVPMNLLPHLQWLTELDYPHVYYVDGQPQTYDVNIFNDDAVHPGGWGTILVVGMRLGGGRFPLDLDNDSVKETIASSAIIVLDVTDPERPPTLLAEITAPELHFTTSVPTLVKARRPSNAGSFANPSVNQWLLVWGSGPEKLDTATSDVQIPWLFAWDLVQNKRVELNDAAQISGNPLDAAQDKGFFGNIAAVDWDNDFVDDALYVGTIEGTAASPTGKLQRVKLDATMPQMGLSTGHAVMATMFDVGKPISARPVMARAFAKNEDWITFGTGRFLTKHDNRTVTRQQLWGIKEDRSDYDTSNYNLANDFVDSTDILLEKRNGEVLVWDGAINSPLQLDAVPIPKSNDLLNFMDNKKGWYRDMAEHHGAGDPAERVFNASLVLRSSVIFTSYVPNADLCALEGEGFLYALNFRTGAAEAYGVLGIDDDDKDGNGEVKTSVSTGEGANSEVIVINSTGNEKKPGDPLTDDPDPDGGSDRTSIILGTSTGDAPNLDLYFPSAGNGRITWEALDIPF